MTSLLSDNQVSAFATPKRSFIVTGASGYLGREIVHTIVQDEKFRDSEVLCLVRESRINEEHNYWDEEVPNKQCSVKVMSYDMLDGGSSLQKALDYTLNNNNNDEDEDDMANSSNKCCCIFHVASVFTPCENHKQMALDNVKGAIDVLKAVEKSPNKQNTRVILTSSIAGVRGTGQTPLNGQWYTYEDWNNLSKLGESWADSYQWSKTESEKQSWEFAKEKRIAFTSLNPSFIFGPPSKPESSQSLSISTVSKWVSGQGPVQSRLCVDVRDVANAHVVAGTTNGSIGKRIIVSTEARIPSETIAEELKRMALELNIGQPENICADTNFDGGVIKAGDKEVDCTTRMEELLDGFRVRSVQETMRDMAKVLLQTTEEKV